CARAEGSYSYGYDYW
nr:immunoglobulin heavy chain junction region [Macaca mulatta]